MSNLQSTQPRLSKVTDPVLIRTRADEKALEIAKMGRVTPVVMVMHLYGNTKSNLLNTSAKNSTKKTKLVFKLKKLDLNQSKTRLKEAQTPQKTLARDW